MSKLSASTSSSLVGVSARLTALAVSFIGVSCMLMSFSVVPQSKAKILVDQSSHEAVSSIYTAIDREQLVKQELPASKLLGAEPTLVPSPKVNEFTRHLNVVALNRATNAELQIITNTTNAFAGRIDQSQLIVVDVVGDTSGEFRGVGFPQIELQARPKKNDFKRFRSLITYADPKTRSQPIPNVRCMGLSPRSVDKRAKRYSKSVEKLAARYSIDANLVRAVMTRESCFDNAARSYVGAMGLMQLMPETAAWLKVEDPTNAHQNLRAGIRYLASLKKRFGTDELALAAYNAGPGNVERYDGIPPFKETRYYVKSVMSHYRSYAATEQFTNAVALN